MSQSYLRRKVFRRRVDIIICRVTVSVTHYVLSLVANHWFWLLTMADYTRWLGGENPRDDARTTREAALMMAGIPKTARGALTASELSKLKKSAEEGLEHKFSLLAPLDGSMTPTIDKLKGVYSVTIRVEELRNSLQMYDMADVFLIANEFAWDVNNDEFRPAQGAAPIDLFTSHADVSMDIIKKSSTFFQRRGQDYHVQNLFWSGTKILNSCDEELRKKIEEQIISFPVEHRTGPVYFKIMIGLILSSSASTMRVLTQQLSDLTIKDFDGESVITYASIMRGVVELLRNNGVVPRDSLDLIASGLKASSTDEFGDYVTHLVNAHSTGMLPLTEEDLLKKAEDKYLDLYARGKWEAGAGKDAQDSVFFVGNCYNCGKPGHMARDCRSPKKDDENGNTAAGRDGAGRGRGYGGRGRGRGGRGGRGERGWRGGRGAGRGERNQGADGEVKQSPPKPGEAHQRTGAKGRTEYWCGRCGRWTDHTTAQHREMAANVDNTDNDKKLKEKEKDSALKQQGALFGGLAANF